MLAGSSGSGVAQVLSVEDSHAEQAAEPGVQISSSNGVAQVLSIEDGHAQQTTVHHSDGSAVTGDSGEASDKGSGNVKSNRKKGAGVSLFGSFKAPVKRQ